MKHKLLSIILFLAIPLSFAFSTPVVTLANTGVSETSKKLTVGVDYTNIENATSICFAKSALNGTDYNLYDAAVDDIAGEFPLSILIDNEKGIHAGSDKDVFIRWKIYTDKAVTISINAKAAMSSQQNMNLPVNWKIEIVGNPEQFSGNDSAKAKPSDYGKDIVVFSSEAKQTAVSGSAAFRVCTETLSDKHMDLPYEGSIVAKIVVGN